MQPVVELKNVTKEFHGIPALRDISFDLRPGEVHALLGENGAGKSTLTKIMAGVYEVTSGELIVNGARVSFKTPAEALRSGIAMVFQETSLVPSLTVAQNIYLGNEKFLNRLRGIYIAAQQFLQSLNFGVDPTMYVSQLGAAQKQMVEIARAVHHKARVIIFDEPTATLTPEEKHHFFALVKRLKRDGVSIIFISHALEEALSISDRITIMRDGQHVVTDDAKNFDRDKIITAMVGRTLSDELYGKAGDGHATRPYGRKMLSVQNLSMGRMVRNNSFSVYAGQITGIFGLIGSGRTETAKIISGVVKRDFFHGGEVKLEGRSVRYRVPRQAVRDGIVYVTEDRKIEGFFETKSIAENIYLNLLAADLNKSVVISYAEMMELAATWTKRLNVRAISNAARVVELSGGNQQKVVIARALVQQPKLVIFDEPTRGVDVGAIAELHHVINELADAGLAVVVISSYLPEILNLADRILVSRQGRVVEEFSADEATEEKIMYAAVH
ncbi:MULTISPECIES: sugar ABC transporter ATP-binding protein [Bradyrhizobium]|jgi:simple sugar transport system ATP-binding protein|uniref:Sugar ABC transporter ATP-binding protein n=2 Tax=Pseudomonadota TaxID=1224 RepID=A0ABS5FZT2_9BRAD|nr:MULTISPECIES: sugar ABC transporter ATP-binding protein [Bradyrhizobium]MBR1134542.1 sugar ABC transporter ATP-binding protein [Bradyrhizobium denitrificans]MDU1491970.1 sugar ABC transporter ATP-binding protein [Bradyrhizobium sp.]MDU1541995.1 sugar ABC transporter ATP-binding protein [Bradyrhizobium sp.]MDU1664857.1 sugar ABC transporter ATP-binding protein [Bradyrhizobium sp.]MDU1803018.1 sugar ABC transporter ATP-binding protein [Bradyrhizobium sp.]